MEFRLIYRGILKGKGNAKQKQQIRRVLHPQLLELWNQPPLTDFHSALPGGVTAPSENPFARKVGLFTFRPLVNSEYAVIAKLDITFLRPEPPGVLVSNSGDIDNRIKTLLDALRMPHNSDEMPTGDTPKDNEDPFCVLLHDDSLITHLSITTDRLLESGIDPQEVLLIIKVKIKVTRATIDNLSLGL